MAKDTRTPWERKVDDSLTKYYLGRPVILVMEIDDGWCYAQWPDGKTWKHWRAQLLDTPWGH
jgi:hypothetical protein